MQIAGPQNESYVRGGRAEVSLSWFAKTTATFSATSKSPEPPIDRGELVQCQMLGRDRKKKKHKNTQGVETESPGQEDSLRASHKCYTGKLQKKTAGWEKKKKREKRGKMRERCKTMSVSCSRPHLTLFLLHQLQESTSFVEKQQRKHCSFI